MCVCVHVCVHARACACMRMFVHSCSAWRRCPSRQMGKTYSPARTRAKVRRPTNGPFSSIFFARLRRASEFLHSKNEKHETVDFPGECTGFKGVLFLKNFLRAILKKLRSARPYREPCAAPRLLLRRRHLESRPSRAKRKRGLRRAAPGPRPSPGVRKLRIKNRRWRRPRAGGRMRGVSLEMCALGGQEGLGGLEGGLEGLEGLEGGREGLEGREGGLEGLGGGLEGLEGGPEGSRGRSRVSRGWSRGSRRSRRWSRGSRGWPRGSRGWSRGSRGSRGWSQRV